MKLSRPSAKFTKYSILISVLVLFLLTAKTAHAVGWADAVSFILGNTIAAFVNGLGLILILLMYLLIWVAQYNDFINSAAVQTGWVILRDVCNMFFILILLVIAFATTLNRENYAMKKLLPKFIIAAILINFSKLICGVIIDFAQVIMLTFVNGFRDIGGGNLAQMLGINDLLALKPSSNDSVSLTSIVGTYILSLLYILIATVVIVVIVAILVMRIVMLWIYVTLSPMAYLLMVLPATEKYAKQWWDQFIQTVVSGPILAFFIWLSFAAITVGSTGGSILGNGQGKDLAPPFQSANDTTNFAGLSQPQAGLTKAGTPDGMLKFIISIGMLMGGLMITKQIGGVAGSIAGSGFDKIKGAAKGVRDMTTRPVTDRWKAFQGQRESARKEKINAFGERAYGSYMTGKNAIKGAPKAAARATFEKARGVLPQSLREDASKVFQNLKSAKDTLTFKDYRDSRATRAANQNLRRAAYQDPNGIYKDAAGQEFNELEKAKDGEFYYRYKTDEEGNKVQQRDAKGDLMQEQVAKRDDTGAIIPGEYEYKPIFEKEYALENWGGTDHKVKKMTEVGYKTNNSWNKSMYNAHAINNRKGEKEINEEQKKMADAGLSPEQLLAMVQDRQTSDKQKLAASMTLAIKEGFKNHQQVKAAESVFDRTNNSLLGKKFGDDIDKKQAYLHYDMESEGGRKKFEKRLVDGKLETQQAKAYEDKNVIQAYSNALTDKEFVKQMEKVTATSNKHDESLKTGYRSHLDTQQPVRKDGKLVKDRLVAKNITGDLNDAVRGQNDSKEKMQSILTESFERMNIGDVVKLKVDTFNPNKKMFDDKDKQAAYETNYKDALEASFRKAFTDKDFDSMLRSRTVDRKLKEAIGKVYKGEDFDLNTHNQGDKVIEIEGENT